MKTPSGISQLSTISFRPATCSFEAISRLNSISKFAKFCVIYSFFQGFLRFDFWPVPGPAGGWAGREQAWRDRTGQGDQGDACKAGSSRAERSGLGDWGQRLHCPAAQPGRTGPVTEYYLIAPDKGNTEAAYIKLQKSTKHTPETPPNTQFCSFMYRPEPIPSR